MECIGHQYGARVHSRIISCTQQQMSILKRIRSFVQQEAQENLNKKATYEDLKNTHPPVILSKLIWGKWIVINYSFCTWQVLMDCLPIQDRLMCNGVLLSSNCIFCNKNNKNSLHLFFNCSQSKELQGKVKAHIGIDSSIAHAQREWFNIFHHYGNKNQSPDRRKVFFAATIYNILRERNRRRFQNSSMSFTTLFHQLVSKVHNRWSCQKRCIQ